MRRFIEYLGLLVKQTVLIVCLLLDLVGIGMFYFGNFNIPQSLLIMIPLIGILVANYRIYIENSPEINVSFSMIKENPLKEKHCEDSYLDFTVNYNLFINNFGNNAGIVEDIRINSIKFCKVEDKFLTDRVGIKLNKFMISDEILFPHFEGIIKKQELKFPIVLEPKQTINKYLSINLNIEGKDKNDFVRILEWIENISCDVIVETRNNNRKSSRKYTVIIEKDIIKNFHIETHQSNLELDNYFKELSNE